jgi:MFS superfamily sulfate permease-like transporter
LKEQNVSGVRESQAEADRRILAVKDRLKNHDLAAKVGLLTIVVILLWQLAIPKAWQIVPAPLVAVVIATLAAVVFVLPVLYVEVPPRLLDDLHFPSLMVLLEGDWAALIQGAVVVAIVASAETLLCATAVDQLHQGKRAKYNRELCAQGTGNMVCGLFGALPMTGVIVRSATNVQAGARSRWSAVMHGLWLLVFVVFLSELIRQIPVAALAAMLVYTGYKLVDVKSIHKLAEYGKGEVLIYFATVGTIVATDLLTGVLTGIALSAGKLLVRVSRLRIDVTEEDQTHITVRLHGTATFLQLPILAEKLENVPRRKSVHIVEEHLVFIDHACLDLILSWSNQYEKSGGEVVLDVDELHTKYHEPGSNGPSEAATTLKPATNRKTSAKAS